MDTFLRIDINIYASILLGFIIVHALSHLDLKNKFNKAFLIGAVVMIVSLIAEALSCVINASSNPDYALLSTVIHVLLFIMAPILTYVWFRIVIYIVKGERDKISTFDYVLLVPVIIQAFAILSSPWTRLFFYVDAANVYHRGTLFAFFAGVTYFYVVLGIIYIRMNRNRIIDDDYLMFVIVSLALIGGGVIQTMFYGTLTMWSFGALGVVFVYFLIHERLIRVDKLTGVWTRDSFERHIKRLIERHPNTVFSALYLDVNGLKDINDKYGHHQGDLVLQAVAQIVREAIRIPHIMARMGGDEFIVMINDDDRLIDQISQQIERQINIANMDHGGIGWSVAIGGGIFRANKHKFDEFVHQIDQMMYDNKSTVTKRQ